MRHKRNKYEPSYQVGVGHSKHNPGSPPYIMIHLSYDEIVAAYGPGSSCLNMTDAFEIFRDDMLKEAEYRGYEGAALFAPVADLYTSWIRNIWEKYYEEHVEPSDPAADGRCDDVADVAESDDGAGAGKA